MRTTEQWLLVNKGHHFNCVRTRTCFLCCHLILQHVIIFQQIHWSHFLYFMQLAKTFMHQIQRVTRVIPSISVQLTAMTRLRKVLNCLLSSATCKLHQTHVLKVLIEHRLSVFLPLLPRILSLSLNLSLRHRMYNCIHHRVVSPHLSLQHEKLPRTLNLSSISSSLPQTRPTFTPSPFVSETHCSSASTWCQESCGYRTDKHHCKF